MSQLKGIDIPPPCTEKVLGQFQGHVQDGYPWEETPCPVKVFGGQYLEFGGDYLSRFKADGWVLPSGDKWWSWIVTYASTHFHVLLEQTRLASAMLAVKHGVPSSVMNSLGMLK